MLSRSSASSRHRRGAMTQVRMRASLMSGLSDSRLRSCAAQVERGPEHANSICSFSGLNDNPDDPIEGGRVQSYGQIVRAGFKSEVPSPGLLCNGHRFPYPEAFQE
jgi:hypothetical protein